MQKGIESMKLKKRPLFANFFILGFLMLILIIIYFFPLAKIIGSSMAPTIQNEQWILTNRMSYVFNEPKRGEIVTINHGDELYIKRIIGLPNEEVAISDQQLYIDGIPYSQRFITNAYHFWTHDIQAVTIPNHSYYVLGDNRRFSNDSRNELGFIDYVNIIDRAVVIVFPLSSWQSIQ